MNQILTDYTKILEGCGEIIYGFVKRKCNKKHLCDKCQGRKEVFLERCQSELEFLESEEIKWLVHEANLECSHQEYLPIQERISQLKEVLEKDGN